MRLLGRRSLRPRGIRDLSGRQVLVTGAGSGIGRAVAESAGRRGAILHLTDINATALARVADAIRAGGGVVGTAEAVDVADLDAVRRLARDVTQRYGSMDVVLNVAGTAVWGTVRGMEHDDWRRLVEINLMGPIHVIEEFVPPMVEARRGGQLVNVSSAAGIIGMPWHAAYSASKFGLRGVSEVLRFDLRRHGIGVTLVCPGAVDTGLVETIRIAGVDAQSRAFQRARAGFRRSAVSPERAADAIWRGVRHNRYWVYTSADIRLVHLLQRVCPPAYDLVMRALNAGANRALPAVEKARRSDLRERR
ncbi:MAG: SDR family oxidoreductase [Nocardioidaceae bacterium]|nr:SDR family oxidoreductase [Nocardioidaceae bacterium]MCL2611784.1 SDR family oxidoreductase [Nocardioidaceae bacterium]